MSQLISGKEAKLLLAQENEVQYLDTRSAFKTLGWCDANDLTGYQFSMKHYKFRLKHRTITINGIEVPKPFEPKEVDVGYVIDGVGVWRTEDEIKQVVAALRKVFKGEDI